MSEPVPFNPKVIDSSIVRKEISLGQSEVMGLQINFNGALIDPTSVVVNIYQEDNYEDSNPDGTLLATYTYGVDSELIREEQGVYSFVLQPELTSVKSLFKIKWNYVISSHTFEYNDYYIVLERMPNYDALSDGEKGVVQQITWMLGDLFDNTVGGTPYFEGEFQTHYSYERIAQLMSIAMNKINLTGQPVTNFRVGPPNAGGGTPMPANGLGILQIATYIEVLKHFVRTYTEQPSIEGANVSFANRRDYMSRWQSVLRDEQENYKEMLKLFKRSFLALGAGRLIVAGGIYGGNGGRGPVMNSVWTTRAMRYYPASFAISGGYYGQG